MRVNLSIGNIYLAIVTFDQFHVFHFHCEIRIAKHTQRQSEIDDDTIDDYSVRFIRKMKNHQNQISANPKTQAEYRFVWFASVRFAFLFFSFHLFRSFNFINNLTTSCLESCVHFHFSTRKE